MKKAILPILIIALIGVSVFAYIMYSSNEASKSDLKKLEVEYEETAKDLSDMEEAFSLLFQETNQKDLKISDLEELIVVKDNEVNNLTSSLEDAEDSLIAVSATLGTLGDPVKGIEALKTEVEDLKKTIETLNEEKSSQDEASDTVSVPDNNESVVEAVDYSATFNEWVGILEQADKDLAGRIDELEATIEPLPALSLERILIQTEIDFLEEIRSDIDGVRADIASQ